MPKPLTIPVLNDEVTLARYPFLPQARNWIAGMASKHQIDIDELLDGSMMEKARIRARSRLVDSVDSDDGVEVASMSDIHRRRSLARGFLILLCSLSRRCE